MTEPPDFREIAEFYLSAEPQLSGRTNELAQFIEDAIKDWIAAWKGEDEEARPARAP